MIAMISARISSRGELSMAEIVVRVLLDSAQTNFAQRKRLRDDFAFAVAGVIQQFIHDYSVGSNKMTIDYDLTSEIVEEKTDG